MDELKDYLASIGPGRIDETADLERLLAEVWADLDGDEGCMAGYKLIGRMEEVVWHPPVLTFVIERHGGTVFGSTRAELQRWAVDVDRMTATCERAGRRQLSPMASRVDVGPMADDIARMINGGEVHDRLRWLGDGRVRVEMGRIFPQQSGYKQTVQGRRRRLREALIGRLGPRGWRLVGQNTFVPASSEEEAERVVPTTPISHPTSSRLRGPYSAGQAELGKRLLELGGAVVCYRPYEPLLSQILERGRPLPGEGSEVRIMSRSQCHTNSATLWYESRGEVRIVSGYALSADGIWRQHSWGLEGGRVIETTSERKLYYGVELDLPLSLVFTLANPPASLRGYPPAERDLRLLGEVVAWGRAH